jgi:hypothetical protein
MSFLSYEDVPLIVGDVRLFAESATLSFSSSVNPQRIDDGSLQRYAGAAPVKGTLNANYILTQRNTQDFRLDSILDINDAGLHDYSTTGFLGEFRFSQAYITSFSFNAEPYKPIRGSMSFDIYGDLEFDSLSAFNFNDLVPDAKNEPIFNGLKSSIEGYDSMMNTPTKFSYQYSLNRKPQFAVGQKYPIRNVIKEAEVTMTIEGDDITENLELSGNFAYIETHLHDIYSEFNNFDYRTSGTSKVLILPKGTPGFLNEGDHRETFNSKSRLMFAPTGSDKANSFVKVSSVEYRQGPIYNEDFNPFPLVAADETVTILTTETPVPLGYRQTGFLVTGGRNEVSPSVYDFTCSGQIENQSINVSNNGTKRGSITVIESIR